MRNIYKKIELISNVAIIVVALLLGGVFVNRYLISASPVPAAAESAAIKAGTKLPLADVDWSKSDKNMLLVLSTTCRYCTESLPFYEKLARQKAERGDVRLIAVMPQSADEARRYLSERNVTVDEIKQANLSIVRGTPTLLMIDRNGVVVESWTGKLPPESEADVINRFFGERSGI